MVGVIATPLLFIAGAGAALFWTLGVTGKYFFYKRIKNFGHVDVVLQWTGSNSFDLYILATLIGGHASLRQAPETPDPFAQEV